MADPRRQFEIVDQIPDDNPAHNDAATHALMLALKTLSQRAIAAIADLFMLVTVGSAFLLWMWTPAPTDRQLIGLGMYGVFVLAANWIVRRK